MLKRWSGRRGSNPRRPAWEYDSKLETKNIAFPGTSFWRLRIPRFHSGLSSRLKRSTNGAHKWKWNKRPNLRARTRHWSCRPRIPPTVTSTRCVAIPERSGRCTDRIGRGRAFFIPNRSLAPRGCLSDRLRSHRNRFFHDGLRGSKIEVSTELPHQCRGFRGPALKVQSRQDPDCSHRFESL